MLEADGDRVFGTQAQLRAGRILGHEHAPPDILAREVDEHVRRLQHRRLDPRIALTLEQRDQRNNGIRLRHWLRPILNSGMLSSNARPGWRLFSTGRVNGGGLSSRTPQAIRDRVPRMAPYKKA